MNRDDYINEEPEHVRVTLSNTSSVDTQSGHTGRESPMVPTSTVLLNEITIGQEMACIHVDGSSGSIFVGIEDESSVIEVDGTTYSVRNEYRGEYQGSADKSTVYMIETNDKYLCFAYGNYIVQFDRTTLSLVRKINANEGGGAFIMDIEVNEHYLICCTTRGIKQWDIETGNLHREIRLREGIYGGITAFKHYLITMEFGEKDLFLWDIDTGSFIVKLRIPMELHQILKDIDTTVEDDGYIYLRSDNYVYAFHVELREISLVGLMFGTNVVPCFVLGGRKMFSFGSSDHNIIEIDASDGSSQTLLSGDPVSFFNVAKMGSRIVLTTGTWEGKLRLYDISNTSEVMNDQYEEDDTNYDIRSTNSDSITYDEAENKSKRCTNKNILTLEDFTDEDDPIMVYLPNSEGNFQKANCMSKDELINYYRAFIGTSLPDNIMCIYTTPKDRNVTGHSGDPTGKIVVKLPTNNIYVTMGSMERIIHSSDTREWFALPLFGGKRRRVGNLKGIFGASMNHGQIPGYVIYKVYTAEEIKLGVVVQEDKNDYPKFVMDNARTLSDLLGDENRINDVFVSSLIDMLTSDP